MSKAQASQRGGFVLGLIVGLLLGLGLALGVALYVTKVPIPFVNKVPQRTAEQDAEEAARNRNWDPNAALGGRGSAKAASGVVGGNSPEPGATPSPTATGPAGADPDAGARPDGCSQTCLGGHGQRHAGGQARSQRTRSRCRHRW